MDNIRTDALGKLVFKQSSEYLRIPSCLYGFQNTETKEQATKSGRPALVHYGELRMAEKVTDIINLCEGHGLHPSPLVCEAADQSLRGDDCPCHIPHSQW